MINFPATTKAPIAKQFFFDFKRGENGEIREIKEPRSPLKIFLRNNLCNTRAVHASHKNSKLHTLKATENNSTENTRRHALSKTARAPWNVVRGSQKTKTSTLNSMNVSNVQVKIGKRPRSSGIGCSKLKRVYAAKEINRNKVLVSLFQ